MGMEIIFQEHPEVHIGGCVFRNVPVIIQHKDTPLLEVGKYEPAGFTTRFPVYHSDGTKIAVVKGARIFLTEEGKRASVTLRNPADMTVC
ncbi:MAG: hypothetical protein IID45_11885, partial [Planctomycetes bacterium]|nr:hypothetical protein [Planctomycetota bacterium]